MNQKFEYQTYLASREWALKKRALRERSGNICERCLAAPYQQTHHLTYKNVGNEPLEELQALCAGCHEFLSAVSDIDPAAWIEEARNEYLTRPTFTEMAMAEAVSLKASEASEWNANIQFLIENIDENDALVRRLVQIKAMASRQITEEKRGF